MLCGLAMLRKLSFQQTASNSVNNNGVRTDTLGILDDVLVS